MGSLVSCTPEEITSLWQARRMEQTPWMETARVVKAMYNSELVVPLPELDEVEKPSVANLAEQGINQTAMRISSTQPEPFFESLKTGVKIQEDAARQRRRGILTWWGANGMPIKNYRRSRYLIAYSSSPVLLCPDLKRKMPEWQVRDPLMTFPAPSGDIDDMTPSDCIFGFQRSLGWLKAKYPMQTSLIARQRMPAGEKENNAEMFDILEYVDAEEIVLVLVGKSTAGEFSSYSQGAAALDLTRYKNLAGVCTAVVPGRITLDRPKGQFDDLPGLYMTQSKLQAMAIVATQRGIFADEWFVSTDGSTPQIITQADGRRGVYGMVRGGKLEQVKTDAGYQTNPMIDRLERNQRLDGGVPAAYGGEGQSNVRTGRAADSVLGAVVDFPIQEAQEIFAAARVEENKRAIAIDKGYWKRSKTFYIDWDGSPSPGGEYVPSKLWESTNHTVKFAQAGVDSNGLTIAIGQLNGTGMMSKRRGMELHPMIDDPEREHDRIIAEGLEGATLSGLEQQAQQGTLPPNDIARISQLVKENKKELFEAIQIAHNEAQQRQAKIDAEGNSSAVDPASAEAQPGLAIPGMGAEAGAAIQAPGQSQQNLAQLLSSIHQSTRGAA